MTVTEEEAKTKRCCGPEGCGDKAEDSREIIPGLKIGPRFCVGSACMAWRYEPLELGFCGYAGG